MSGVSLPRTGRSGDSWLTPFPNLLMPDGFQVTSRGFDNDFFTQKDTQPSQNCSEGYTFYCYMSWRCFFVFEDYQLDTRPLSSLALVITARAVTPSPRHC
jgi:hypothetical protein